MQEDLLERFFAKNPLKFDSPDQRSEHHAHDEGERSNAPPGSAAKITDLYSTKRLKTPQRAEYIAIKAVRLRAVDFEVRNRIFHTPHFRESDSVHVAESHQAFRLHVFHRRRAWQSPLPLLPRAAITSTSTSAWAGNPSAIFPSPCSGSSDSFPGSNWD